MGCAQSTSVEQKPGSEELLLSAPASAPAPAPAPAASLPGGPLLVPPLLECVARVPPAGGGGGGSAESSPSALTPRQEKARAMRQALESMPTIEAVHEHVREKRRNNGLGTLDVTPGGSAPDRLVVPTMPRLQRGPQSITGEPTSGSKVPPARLPPASRSTDFGLGRDAGSGGNGAEPVGAWLLTQRQGSPVQ
jgi:hypothetical protein